MGLGRLLAWAGLTTLIIMLKWSKEKLLLQLPLGEPRAGSCMHWQFAVARKHTLRRGEARSVGVLGSAESAGICSRCGVPDLLRGPQPSTA